MGKTDYLDKQQAKAISYMNLFVRVGLRFAERLKAASDEDVELQHKVMVQLFIIRKMYGRALENMYQEAADSLRRVDREREIYGNPKLKKRQYKKLVRSMKPIQKRIADNEKWFLGTVNEMRSNGLVLTVDELQTALSMPVEEIARRMKGVIPMWVMA